MGSTRPRSDENNILSFQGIAMIDNNHLTAFRAVSIQMICKNGNQGYGSHLPDLTAKCRRNDVIKEGKYCMEAANIITSNFSFLISFIANSTIKKFKVLDMIKNSFCLVKFCFVNINPGYITTRDL